MGTSSARERERAKPEQPAGTGILQPATFPSPALSLRTFLQHPALTEQEFKSHPPHINARCHQMFCKFVLSLSVRLLREE